MKESITHIENPRLLFRETFRDEQSVIRNGGTPTDVTFSNGVATFNGTSSILTYQNAYINPAGFSFRIKFNIDNLSGSKYIFSKYDGTNIGFILLVSDDKLRFYTGGTGANYAEVTLTETENIEAVGLYDGSATKLYVNSVVGTNAATPLAPYQFNYSLYGGAKYNSTNWWGGDIDLIEIYNYALSAEEVANLYEGKRFHELAVHGQSLGSDIASGWDFSNWTNWQSTDAGNLVTITGVSGGIYKNYFTVGKRYKVTMTGISSVTGAGTFYISNGFA
jgi:hypothetical protein